MDQGNIALAERLDSAFDKLGLSSYASQLPSFADENGGTGFMSFLEKFNEIGNIMGLTKVKLIRLLPAHLKDVAKAVFDNFDAATKTNWRAAITRLQAHFSSDYYLNFAKEQIKYMTMFNGEAPVMFSNRVRKAILEAFPGDSEGLHRTFLQNMAFTNGLPDTIKQKLKLVGPLALNYEQLVKDADRMWNVVRTDGSTHENGTLIVKIDQVLDTLTSQPRTVSYIHPIPSAPRSHPSRNWQNRYNNNSNYSQDRQRYNGFDRVTSGSAFQSRSRTRTPPRQHVRFAPNQGYENQQGYFNRPPQNAYSNERNGNRQNNRGYGSSGQGTGFNQGRIEALEAPVIVAVILAHVRHRRITAAAQRRDTPSIRSANSLLDSLGPVILFSF
ncbi:unnamed protein product [Heligmosomoides polygyrus]|uniref:Retrotrans_gag domain-containing protein n=1 Tax=Heligmosomoides polygyrus TaxID=6339 RepID=A0A183GE03_HELPZ|nr:unnamed protein product [Heligmosomoides polygyrus]